MGNLANSISDGIKDAMRAKDRDRLSALRDIKSKIMLEATKEGAGDTVDDAVTMSILSKLLKQRKETAALYHEQGRADLAAEEEAQAAVIQEFLPLRCLKRKSKPELRKSLLRQEPLPWPTWAKSWAWHPKPWLDKRTAR